MMVDILANVTAVKERIAQAARNAGRDPDEITLVAVTKTWPVDVVLAAYEAGLRHFGENRTNELVEKKTAVSRILGKDNGITWHFIGALQSRQSRYVADFADTFHALDRLKIARRLSAQCQENGRTLPVYLEVNVSGEATKSGFQMSNWEESETQRAEMRTVVDSVRQMPGLQVVGLMTMAPWHAPQDEIRAVFRRTRELAHWLETAVPDVRLSQLSMGMTDDFELAIAEGATHVRIGRALFGSRPK